MKQICINLGTQTLQISYEKQGGSITSGLQREVCPGCSNPDCYFDCDLSQIEDETEEEARERLCYNAQLDALESFILALACTESYDMEYAPFVEAVQATLDAMGNN